MPKAKVTGRISPETIVLGELIMGESRNASVIEVEVSADGKRIWINVDGECRFRAQEVGSIVIKDERDKLSVFASV